MAGRHPLIAFLAGLPQFDAIALTDSVLELRSGCVVSASRSAAAGDADSRFRLNLAWPGGSRSAAPTHEVDAYKYIALQVQEAARLGFDLQLMAQSAERAMLDASEWRSDVKGDESP
ncbi:hypothetical protein [Paraburkholderia fynbosensis]|uniref:Uncharacterized protein n=1 Tax=Paraburkholderia fynbosensis TaxID=1200993 RepID=A0A6J5FWF4_9BURK|nr:hypothetical protein [Paraburkholderia fynbosensis]CAB3786810.1 hypothetical protein LMG27177_02082 [Paraburkholderia fynbosensis]